jgi:hypothetical protein
MQQLQFSTILTIISFILADIQYRLHRAAVVAIMLTVSLVDRVYQWSARYTTAGGIMLAVDHITGVDVTNTVRAFYLIDRTKTVAALHRWFARHHGAAPETVDIVFALNGVVYASRLELTCNKEMLTGRDADDGDIDLSHIPAHGIHRVVRG